jgi:hypothetical protein
MQHAPLFERRKDPLRVFPPAANQELPLEKELHVSWQERFLRRAHRQPAHIQK